MMRSALAWGGAVALLVSMGTAPAASAAPAADTYQGTWDSAQFCGYDGPVSGNWTVVVQPDGTAVVRLVMFTERGRLHAAWGGQALKNPLAQVSSDPLVVAGGAQTFTIDGNQLVYEIDPFPCDGVATHAVVLGTVAR